ncbi:MAG TPA: GFA family protein [Gammaproteobacteria bacterium]|nr:GFA family protein [Gammaproteobacteria bacterium]
MAQTSKGPSKHAGSCHCGAVRFEAEVDATSGGMCNCTVCTKLGAITSLVKPEAFRLLSDESNLSFYEWGGKTAKRYFCKTCGITCFGRGYLEQVGGAYVSVSLNALDDVDPADLKVKHWDGRHNNWEAGTRDEPWPIFA